MIRDVIFIPKLSLNVPISSFPLFLTFDRVRVTFSDSKLIYFVQIRRAGVEMIRTERERYISREKNCSENLKEILI